MVFKTFETPILNKNRTALQACLITWTFEKQAKGLLAAVQLIVSGGINLHPPHPQPLLPFVALL